MKGAFRVLPRSARGIVGACLTLGLFAMGCSPAPNPFAGEPPGTIFTNAMKLLKGSASVEVNIQTYTGTLALDFTGRIFSNGDVDGTVGETYSNGAFGPTIQIVKVAGSDYLRAGASYWRQDGLSSSAATVLANDWVSLPDTSTNIGSSLSVIGIADKAMEDLVGWGSASTGSFDGEAAVGLSSASTSHNLEVATAGPGYAIEIEAAPEADRILFGAWNVGTAPSVPGGAAPSHFLRSYQSPVLSALESIIL
jgi:hypothetical protein